MQNPKGGSIARIGRNAKRKEAEKEKKEEVATINFIILCVRKPIEW